MALWKGWWGQICLRKIPLETERGQTTLVSNLATVHAESLSKQTHAQACGHTVCFARSAFPCSLDGHPLLIFLVSALMALPSGRVP